MSDVFAAWRPLSVLLAAAFLLTLQSAVSIAQDGAESQGSHGPMPSLAEDNGRERGGDIAPPSGVERSPIPVLLPQIPRGPADATGQTLVVKMERPKLQVRRRQSVFDPRASLRFLKIRKAIFSSDRGG